MTKSKKKGRPNLDADGQEQGSTTVAEHHHTAIHHTHINRTHSKLPTKRKQLRQEAKSSAPPPSQYEFMSRPPRPEASRGGSRGWFRGRGGGRGGLGHASRNNARPSNHGFSMQEEAINTNDNYCQRSWMADQRSTLRYQGIQFVQAGELSNKDPTPTPSDNEEQLSNSNEEHTETVVTVIEKSTVTIEPTSHRSTARMEPYSAKNNDPVTLDEVKSSSTASISRLRGSNSDQSISDPVSISERTPKSPISLSEVPLPPIQFISTEENIVFTPRNQRRRLNRPQPTLTNWEVPADFKTMTSATAPEWTKPRKKQNRRKGHKQFLHFVDGDDQEIMIDAVNGLPMTSTAEEALNDYLENIRAQGDSDEDDAYIETLLAGGDVGERAMSEMSLDEKETSKATTSAALGGRTIPRSGLSQSATPARVESPETVASVASVTVQGSKTDIGDADKTVHITSSLAPNDHADEDDNWISNPQESKEASDSSGGESDAFDTKGDLLEDDHDPVWNTDSGDEISGSKAKQKEPDSDEDYEDEDYEDDDEEDDGDDDEDDDDDDDEDEDDDDDDILLEEDEDIIARMILDDFDLDDLNPSHPLTRQARKSLIRQPNVPVLPLGNDEIAAHLQALWKHDRISKKERKQERERARLNGLLGNKGKSKSRGKRAKRAARRDELERVSELEGGSLTIDMRKIDTEIREFWEDDTATDYALPPMDRFVRKIVHTLANAYNLSSKSHGAGKTRFTTLFKTMKTSDLPLNEHKIRTIIKRTAWVAPSDRSGFAGGFTPTAKVKRHKDGDVVGGDAKEIASDNRGRQMLEKLGWRSGMGLGAEGMGMKLPVFAVVKAGKSGLQ